MEPLFFFFLGLGRLFDISCGINGSIILTSQMYKWDLPFQVFLVIMSFISNLLLIPIMGIEGAAFSDFDFIGPVQSGKSNFCKVEISHVPLFFYYFICIYSHVSNYGPLPFYSSFRKRIY